MLRTEQEALDQVFGASLEEFTAVRNDLAKKLAEAGDREGAARIKALKKPTVSAWAINRIARDHPNEMSELMAMHERVGGASGSKELRAATDERRKLISKLETLAAKALNAAGHGSSGTTMQKISQSLLAAASGEQTEVVQAGRLTRDLDVPGFGAMEGFELAADSPVFERTDDKARERAEDLDRRAREAEAEAAELTRATETAREKADRLAKEAEAASNRAEKARAKATKALDELSG